MELGEPLRLTGRVDDVHHDPLLILGGTFHGDAELGADRAAAAVARHYPCGADGVLAAVVDQHRVRVLEPVRDAERFGVKADIDQRTGAGGFEEQ